MASPSGLTWQALQWADGTRYEGLTKAGKLHSHGVLTFPNKDRYEGQFEDGRMHGAGVYVWSNGTIYRGDWAAGRMHGCGTLLAKPAPGGDVAAAEGKFFACEFVGDVMPCAASDGYEAAVEADVAAYQARSFMRWRQQPAAAAPAAAAAGARGGSSSGGRQRQQQGQQQSSGHDDHGRGVAPGGLSADHEAALAGVVQQLAVQAARPRRGGGGAT